MIDIFDTKPLKMNEITCHSGGAVGSDTVWEKIGDLKKLIKRKNSIKQKIKNLHNIQ